ncbi:MAG: NUDIX domain-containing protein [Minisyncoccia bacterium]
MKRGKDYIGVGAGVFVINDQGKIFITQRGGAAQNRVGKWIIPGGAVELGETRAQTAVREIKEEHDMTVEILEELQTSDHILTDESQHWVSTAFICRHVDGEPKNLEPEKCAEIGWFTVAEAEKLDLSDITRSDLAAFKKKYPNGYRPV